MKQLAGRHRKKNQTVRKQIENSRCTVKLRHFENERYKKYEI
jgi:hypothetical protein